MRESSLINWSGALPGSGIDSQAAMVKSFRDSDGFIRGAPPEPQSGPSRYRRQRPGRRRSGAPTGTTVPPTSSSSKIRPGTSSVACATPASDPPPASKSRVRPATTTQPGCGPANQTPCSPIRPVPPPTATTSTATAIPRFATRPASKPDGAALTSQSLTTNSSAPSGQLPMYRRGVLTSEHQRNSQQASRGVIKIIDSE